MLSCRDITEQATEYLERSQPFWSRALFRLHLGMCRHCQEFVRQIELTADALRAAASPVGPGPDDALMAAFVATFESTQRADSTDRLKASGTGSRSRS